MTKQKRKFKYDLYSSLKRLELVKVYNSIVGFIAMLIIFPSGILSTVVDIELQSGHNILALICVVSMSILYISVNFDRALGELINEREKQIREQERRFPPDILDRPIRLNRKDDGNQK